jgi:hypothetical protein
MFNGKAVADKYVKEIITYNRNFRKIRENRHRAVSRLADKGALVWRGSRGGVKPACKPGSVQRANPLRQSFL